MFGHMTSANISIRVAAIVMRTGVAASESLYQWAPCRAEKSKAHTNLVCSSS